MATRAAALRQLLTTNLWIKLLATFFALLVNGLIWSSVFEYYFAGFGGGLISFAGASLSMIVGQVYSNFLGKMMRDYLAAPTSYMKLLVRIGNAGDAVAGIYRSGLARDPILRIKAMLQHLAFYGFRLFAPENSDRLGLVELRPVVSLARAARGSSLSDLASRDPVTYAISSIPEDLERVAEAAHWEDPMRLMHDLRIYMFLEVARMRDAGIDTEVIRMALSSLKPVWDQIEAIESDRLIREPAIFDAHMRVLFVVYFFVWVPISSWAAVGWLASWIAYPFVSLAFLAFGVYNSWIGDPFDPGRPVLVGDLLGAREWFSVTEMERKFADAA